MRRLLVANFCCVSVFTFGLSLSALAQDNSTSANVETSSSDGAERIEVTGSLIKRIDIEGPNPVLVYEREELEASGSSNVGSFLADSSASPFGGNGVEVNLRGLSSTRTLVLVNGYRMAGSGSSYDDSAAIDVNQIPLSAVERIEILRDGASSRYGSEALAGVVNIITRKDLNGFSVANRYRHTMYKGSDENQLSITYGMSRRRFSWLSSLQLDSREGDRAIDNPWRTKVNRRYIFNDNYRVSGSSAIHAGPDCVETEVINGAARCMETSKSQGSRGITNFSTYNQLNYEISDDLEYEGIVIFRDRHSHYQWFPDSNDYSFKQAEVPAGWAAALDHYDGTKDIKIWEKFETSANNGRKTTTNTTGVINSVSGVLGESLGWKLSNNHQLYRVKSIATNLVLFNESKAAILNGTYDPYGTAKDISSFVTDLEFHDKLTINWTELTVSDEIGSFLGLDWSFGGGIVYSHSEYADNPAQESVDGNTQSRRGSRGGGSRSSYGGLIEFGGVAGDFETQIAVRYDKYNDFGDTTNPKLGFKYRLNPSLAFRTSYGTGFKAPSLQEAYGPTLTAFSFVVDQLRCNDPSDPDPERCQAVAYPSTFGGNRELKEERSESFNFGVIAEVSDNFAFGVDWWNYVIRNVITANIRKALEAEARLGDNPSFDSKYPGLITRDPTTNHITALNATYQNQAARKVQGIDFSFKYLRPTKMGKFTLGNELSYISFNKETIFDELGEQDTITEAGRPRWRNNMTLQFEKDKLNTSLTMKTFAENKKASDAAEDDKIDKYDEFDFQIGYDFNFGNLQLGAQNVFNTHPELDEFQTTSIRTTLYRRERLVYMTYKNDF